jgi:hypothetical protein
LIFLNFLIVSRPFGGVFNIMIEGRRLSVGAKRLLSLRDMLRDITARSMLRTTLLRNVVRNRRRKAPTADEIFYFYSLANGQSIVRESDPFVRRSSRH